MRSVHWECGNEDLDINGGGRGWADGRGHSPNTSSSASASGVEDIFNLKEGNLNLTAYGQEKNFYLGHIQYRAVAVWAFQVVKHICH